jgi:hypothetical protein
MENIDNLSYEELKILRDQIDLRMQILDKQIDVQLGLQADITKNRFLFACASAMLHQKWAINPVIWRKEYPEHPLAYYLTECVGKENSLSNSEKIIYDNIMNRFDLIKYVFTHTHYNFFNDGHYCMANEYIALEK